MLSRKQPGPCQTHVYLNSNSEGNLPPRILSCVRFLLFSFSLCLFSSLLPNSFWYRHPNACIDLWPSGQEFLHIIQFKPNSVSGSVCPFEQIHKIFNAECPTKTFVFQVTCIEIQRVMEIELNETVHKPSVLPQWFIRITTIQQSCCHFFW